MLKAVLIDDEQPAIDMLKILLARTGQVAVVSEYTKSSEALKQVGKLQPDAVFLDVEMPGINGLELAARLTEEAPDADIVFVTAFRQYAVEAFEVNAIDYLLKPVQQEQINRAVSRLFKYRKSSAVLSQTGSRIVCFGKLEVWPAGSESPLKWRTAKVEELFAYLLYYRGTIVRKGKLIEVLWPECEAEAADNNLHTTVYRLKKTLKERGMDISVKLSGGGYLLQLGSGIYLDAEEFEAHISRRETVRRETIAGVEKIIELYQGDYFDGKDYQWCEAERVRLQHYYADLVKLAARYYMDGANYAKARQLLLRNIACLPYDEEAYEMLLRICALQLDRVGMITYYRQLENLLQTELGIEPRPSLRRLYENLMNEC